MQSAMVWDFDPLWGKHSSMGNGRPAPAPQALPRRISLSDDRLHAALRFYSLDDGVGEFRGSGGAAYIAREFAAVAVDVVDGVADLQSRVVLTQMAQHEQG